MRFPANRSGEISSAGRAGGFGHLGQTPGVAGVVPADHDHEIHPFRQLHGFLLPVGRGIANGRQDGQLRTEVLAERVPDALEFLFVLGGLGGQEIGGALGQLQGGKIGHGTENVGAGRGIAEKALDLGVVRFAEK